MDYMPRLPLKRKRCFFELCLYCLFYLLSFYFQPFPIRWSREFSQEQWQGEKMCEDGCSTSASKTSWRVCVSADVAVVPSETGECIKKGGSAMLTLSGSSSLRRTRRQTPGRSGSDTFFFGTGFAAGCGEMSPWFSHVCVCVSPLGL